MLCIGRRICLRWRRRSAFLKLLNYSELDTDFSALKIYQSLYTAWNCASIRCRSCRWQWRIFHLNIRKSGPLKRVLETDNKQNLMFSTAIFQCISIFHFKWNKNFPVKSIGIYISLTLYFTLKCSVWHSLWMLQFIYYYVQHLKSLVNFVILGRVIDWTVWLMKKAKRHIHICI